MFPIKYEFSNIKYFMAHQYIPKIFHDPCKKTQLPAPPTYLMYGLVFHNYWFWNEVQGMSRKTSAQIL